MPCFNSHAPHRQFYTLESEEQRQLFDIIDDLRAHGLHGITYLPQIIICGDQSCGKSSVLEAISRVSFPKKENLCTRFVTEVILRRKPETENVVSIVAGANRSPQQQAELELFKRRMDNLSKFPDVYIEATAKMGLSPLSEVPKLSSGAKAFCQDILRIEVAGPQCSQLTLVDLPGLIHVRNKSQTAADIELVRSLVCQYMKNPRSIILAIITAKNDYANQIVLQHAKKHDPRENRTMGIITKPDTLLRNSESEKIINLAQNKEIQLKLGWHVLKNIDTGRADNGPHSSRDDQEQDWFEKSNFRTLSQNSRGISSLRQRLSSLLFKQIKAELPNVMKDIRKLKGLSEQQLKKLGPSRKSHAEQVNFLVGLTTSFRSLCEAACSGRYGQEIFGNPLSSEGKERHLRSHVEQEHRAFKKRLDEHGSAWKVIPNGALRDEKNENEITEDQAIERVIRLLDQSRGQELPGTYNPDLIGKLFHEYSEPWSLIVLAHISTIKTAIELFLKCVFSHLTTRPVADALLKHWIRPRLEERYSKTKGLLQEHLASLKTSPRTFNKEFSQQVAKLDAERNVSAVTASLLELFKSRPHLNARSIPLIVEAINKTARLEMDTSAAISIYNYMKGLYNTLIELFGDHVIWHIIDRGLLGGLETIFSPTDITGKMDVSMVRFIAAESDSRLKERDALEKKLHALQYGEDTIGPKLQSNAPGENPPHPLKLYAYWLIRARESHGLRRGEHRRIAIVLWPESI
ncbi:MAG: hypothetical protein M1814_001872 [Vezdaea aestivalis]|nr:MAG: hypothetical protein M1814_001872 [Vezdaea aestivalis]